MAVRLRLQGHDGFVNYLRELPDTVAARVRVIVYRRANAAKTRIQAAYPPRDPTSKTKFPPLASTMVVEPADVSRTHPRAILNQPSMLGRWYEVGTPDRYTKKRQYRGRMPALPTFVPPAVAERRQMALEIEAVLDELGFTVTR